jgi:hypothetical protein
MNPQTAVEYWLVAAGVTLLFAIVVALLVFGMLSAGTSIRWWLIRRSR